MPFLTFLTVFISGEKAGDYVGLCAIKRRLNDKTPCFKRDMIPWSRVGSANHSLLCGCYVANPNNQKVITLQPYLIQRIGFWTERVARESWSRYCHGMCFGPGAWDGMFAGQIDLNAWAKKNEKGYFSNMAVHNAEIV